VICPHCRGDARFVEYRECRLQTLLGEVAYERAYYHCRQCRSGWLPTDAELRVVKRRSPGQREVIVLGGVVEAFEQGGRNVLQRLSGVSVSASTIRRVTEAAGKDIAEKRSRGETIGPEAAWEWNEDAGGRRTAYISLDGVTVLQQGPHAQKAEAKVAWMGAVFNPQPLSEKKRRRVWDRRYVSGLMTLPEIGRQLHRECEAVGLSRADVVVALTDGGNGLEDCLIEAVRGLSRETHFVLDFYHASEHLVEFAKALAAHDEDRRKSLAHAWCRMLKHEGGEVLLKELKSLDLAGHPPAVREAHRQLTGYVAGNRHRMDYPQYVKNGWEIGSGMIESACKTVVNHRLKQAGMRWRPPGTTELCHLRALYKSETSLWQAYWLSTI
jgi:hypothetical protein